jgi:HEAT repeat protein
MVAFALADEERDVQLAAVRALGKLRRAEPLCNVIGASRDPELVAAALRALGDADPERAFRAARPLVKHLDASIACAAVEAIGRLAPKASTATPSDRQDALFQALSHPEVEVVKVALAELATALDARTLARLGLCLDHGSWEVRRTAAELLGQEGGPSARALLRARFEREKDTAVREAIARAVSLPTPSMVAGPESTGRGATRGPVKGGGRQ